MSDDLEYESKQIKTPISKQITRFAFLLHDDKGLCDSQKSHTHWKKLSEAKNIHISAYQTIHLFSE